MYFKHKFPSFVFMPWRTWNFCSV